MMIIVSMAISSVVPLIEGICCSDLISIRLYMLKFEMLKSSTLAQISKRVLEEKEDRKMAKMQKKVFSEAKKQYTKVTEDGVEKMVAKSVQSAKKVQKKMAKEHLDKENRNHDLAKRFEAAKNHEVPSYMKTTEASAHKGFKVPKTSPKTKTGASKRK